MTRNLKKVTIADIADKEASMKKRSEKPSQNLPIEEKTVYTKPKTEFEDKKIDDHPVLKKLKKLLAIDTAELHHKEVNVAGDKLTFSLTEYSEELNIFCVEEYSRQLMTSGSAKATKIFDYMRIGCSLVAIDMSPIYEIYGLELELEELDRISKNKYDLSDRMRKECSKIFSQSVMKDLRDFIGPLEEFFVDKIVNKAQITAFDSLKPGQEVFVCDVPGCTFIHTNIPMFDDAGREIPFVCAIHSSPLKKALTPNEKSSFPLA